MSAPSGITPVYTLTVAATLRTLRSMAAIMDKAELHARANAIPLENLLQARLAPDMMNLLQQFQYVCFLAVDFGRHVSDAPPPRVGYDERTWAEVRASLATASDYLEAVSPARVNADAHRIVPTFMDEKRGMTVLDYAASVITPDLNFHAVIAYALLRHNGVPLGKSDFLGKLETTQI